MRGSTASADGASRDAFEAFRQEQRAWLDDFALFMAIKDAEQRASLV